MDKEPNLYPVWLMRQAGRYMPEYMAIKNASKGFLDMALTPDKAAEITMQPIKEFDMDAAIIFSDILIIPYALGQPLDYHQDLNWERSIRNILIQTWMSS